MKLKTYPTTVMGLPANPKYIDMPCGCRVLDGNNIHVVKNETLNISIVQCLNCKKIIDVRPVSTIENVS